jgi:hypothetical protein
VGEELHGAWWTPDAPDLRVPGSLTRVEDGWRLNLIGTLMVDSGGWDGLHLVPPRTLWGACHGVPYTLLQCFLDDDVQGPGPNVTRSASDQWTMTWRIGQLVRGGEITEATRFPAAEFEITGMPAWWPPSGLRGQQARSGSYIPPADVTIPLDDGTFSIGVREIRHGGRRVRSVRERVMARIEKSSGFTLDELEKEIVGPMRALIAIGVAEPVSVFNLRVVPEDPHTEDGRPRSFAVDPHDGEGPEEPAPAMHAPLPLSPSLDGMPSFIPAWLKLARRCSVPLDAVEPRRRSGALQLQLLDVVNAAETLHRALHEEPTEHPFAESVRKALEDAGGFNGAQRRDVRDAVKVFMGITLEKRLLALAEELGPEVCQWLFNGTVRPWAYVTARIRNVLSHGLTVSDGVHEDPRALAGALYLTEAVITLRLLTQAGLPSGTALTTQLGRHPGMRSLTNQSIADWPALAHRINPNQWPQPQPEPSE